MSTATLAVFDAYVDGRPRAPAAGDRIESINPAVDEPWAAVADCSREDVDAAVEAACRAFRGDAWRSLTATARGRLLSRLAVLIAGAADAIAATETRDNGKLLREMSGQLHRSPTGSTTTPAWPTRLRAG